VGGQGEAASIGGRLQKAGPTTALDPPDRVP
jgi:hypothetical protein